MLNFDLKKKTYEKRRRRHCLNGEQQKVIEMKDIVVLVKVDEI